MISFLCAVIRQFLEDGLTHLGRLHKLSQRDMVFLNNHPTFCVEHISVGNEYPESAQFHALVDQI